jgi:hypothetical protein
MAKKLDNSKKGRTFVLSPNERRLKKRKIMWTVISVRNYETLDFRVVRNSEMGKYETNGALNVAVSIYSEWATEKEAEAEAERLFEESL